ncbi:hypothetical protein V2J09_007473 [Rumex salicifolius]
MASIRRTLSPAHHDPTPYLNGSPASPGSSTQKFQSNLKPSCSLSALFAAIRRFVVGLLSLKQYRRCQHWWRRSISWCFLFFLIGLLLGLMPFGQVDEIRNHDFSFEIEDKPIYVEEEQGQGKIPVTLPYDAEIGTVVLSDWKVKERFDYKPRELLVVVTPTYNRALQAYYLNRLGHVLRLVNPPVLWIVVEMNVQSPETAEILRKTGVLYRHLVCTKNMTNIKDRGVQQRNTAIEHIESHKLDGIVYFGDDDNIYSLELFKRIRKISRFGSWPVAMLTQSKSKAILEGPVCNETEVVGWLTNEKSKRLRRFHVDMSGFAFNSTILWDPRRWKRPYLNPIRQLDTMKEGFQETTFIEQLVADESQMEGVPAGCKRIMNWHLHLDAHGYGYPKGWFLDNNLVPLVGHAVMAASSTEISTALTCEQHRVAAGWSYV